MRVRGSHKPVITCTVVITSGPNLFWDSPWSCNWTMTDNCGQCNDVLIETNRNGAGWVELDTNVCGDGGIGIAGEETGATLQVRITVRSASLATLAQAVSTVEIEP